MSARCKHDYGGVGAVAFAAKTTLGALPAIAVMNCGPTIGPSTHWATVATPCMSVVANWSTGPFGPAVRNVTTMPQTRSPRPLVTITDGGTRSEERRGGQ